MKVDGFDIIGDIHGHADALVRSLKELGYKEKKGLYSHSHRKVVFLGDFIDKDKELSNNKFCMDHVVNSVKTTTETQSH